MGISRNTIGGCCCCAQDFNAQTTYPDEWTLFDFWYEGSVAPHCNFYLDGTAVVCDAYSVVPAGGGAPEHPVYATGSIRKAFPAISDAARVIVSAYCVPIQATAGLALCSDSNSGVLAFNGNPDGLGFGLTANEIGYRGDPDEDPWLFSNAWAGGSGLRIDANVESGSARFYYFYNSSTILMGTATGEGFSLNGDVALTNTNGSAHDSLCVATEATEWIPLTAWTQDKNHKLKKWLPETSGGACEAGYYCSLNPACSWSEANQRYELEPVGFVDITGIYPTIPAYWDLVFIDLDGEGSARATFQHAPSGSVVFERTYISSGFDPATDNYFRPEGFTGTPPSFWEPDNEFVLSRG